MQVNVLLISHKHGTNVTVHKTHEGALEKLASYVKEEWRTDQLGDRPEADGDAVQEYFADGQMGEFFDIEECEIQE